MKSWEELTISDNFIFQQVMEDSEICKEFLEKLLGISIRKLTYVELEKFFKMDTESKGIRLDVYAEDEKDSVYDIEMQTTNSPNDSLPKRTLYYQALIVANQIKKGKDYAELKKTFVIFVCTFDPFGEGRRIYTFKSTCVELPKLELKNGATTIFLNAKGTSGNVNSDIEHLLSFINGAQAQGNFTKNIAEKVDEVKFNERLKVGYMSGYAEEMRIRRISFAEGEAQGIAKGEAQGIVKGEAQGIASEKLRVIKSLLSEKAPLELIAKVTGWTKEKILELAQAESLDTVQEKNLVDNA